MSADNHHDKEKHNENESYHHHHKADKKNTGGVKKLTETIDKTGKKIIQEEPVDNIIDSNGKVIYEFDKKHEITENIGKAINYSIEIIHNLTGTNGITPVSDATAADTTRNDEATYKKAVDSNTAIPIE